MLRWPEAPLQLADRHLGQLAEPRSGVMDGSNTGKGIRFERSPNTVNQAAGNHLGQENSRNLHQCNRVAAQLSLILRASSSPLS